MFGRLFRKKKKTSIGLDLVDGHYFGIRLEFTKEGPRITHQAQSRDLSIIGEDLEAADLLVTRPPLTGYFNRRTIEVDGDWTDEGHLSLAERGYAIYKQSSSFTSVGVDEIVYGWRVLSFDEHRKKSEVEVHQAGGTDCAQLLKPLQVCGLGPVQLDALHGPALGCVIPEKFSWYILETRCPDGFCLIRKKRLVAHIRREVLVQPSADRLDADKLRSYLEDYHQSGQSGLCQVFFLDPKAPHIRGLSCSWVGDNCAELVNRRVEAEYLQALGLAMSSEPSWWLHHISEFYRTPG